MDAGVILEKFGSDYEANERTFKMGIDRRFTTAVAERFRNRIVLETCTGGGFTTISLAAVARHVITIEIDPVHQAQARHNVRKAGGASRVTLVHGDIMDEGVWRSLPAVNSAFLDPDWADTGPHHVYRFINSNTRPPADALLQKVLALTPNAALILPPLLDVRELDKLPAHERQCLYTGGSLELLCLYFGDLALTLGETALRV